jgi:hypothetical protein
MEIVMKMRERLARRLGDIWTDAADEIERLRAGYAECIEDMEDWASYADRYNSEFDIKDDIKRHEAILKESAKAQK